MSPVRLLLFALFCVCALCGPTMVAAQTCTLANSAPPSVVRYTQVENYLQMISFFNASCTSNLTVEITDIPSSSAGVFYQYTTPVTINGQIIGGRSAPVTTVPFSLTSSMLMFQPALNQWSVSSDPLRNTTMAVLTYIVKDNLGGATANLTREFWYTWTNQPSEISSQSITKNTQMPSFDNIVITLSVVDSDVVGGVTQTVVAYINDLPAAGTLYQYDPFASFFRGPVINTINTMVTDSSYRVVFQVATNGTGRPYASFTYTADDGIVESLPETVTINILIAETPVSVNQTINCLQNGNFTITLGAISSAATASLNRAVIESLPARGALFQYLDGGAQGPRVVVPSTPVTNADRKIIFRPDPYTTQKVNGVMQPEYANFQFSVNNGVGYSNISVVSINVTAIHLQPNAQSLTARSDTGNDVSIQFIGSSPEEVQPRLWASVMTVPKRGTLKQVNGTIITNNTMLVPGYCTTPCNVTDSRLQVIYSPEQGARYNTTFTYAIWDETLFSNNATVVIYVGGVIRPPIVYNSTFTLLQNETLIIQLNGTVQDVGDTWSAFISKLPSKGQLYQMNGGLKGALIEQQAATPVSDPNYLLMFVPDRFSTSDSFEFYGQNADAYQSKTASVTFNIIPVNAPPEVAGQTVTIKEGQKVTITLYAVDYDDTSIVGYISKLPSGTLYQYNATCKCAGAAITSPDTAITDSLYRIIYIPPYNVHGQAALNYQYSKFEYRFTDNKLWSNNATVVISITAVDDPPIVKDGSLVTPMETDLTIYFTQLVTDPDADEPDAGPYRVIIASYPKSGQLLQVATGTGKADALIPTPNLPVTDTNYRIIYRPRLNGWGAPYDSFTYFAEDTKTTAKSIRFGTIQINVTFVIKPPTISSFDARMNANQGSVITLLTRDAQNYNRTTYITKIGDGSLPANLTFSGQLFQYVANGSSSGLNVNAHEFWNMTDENDNPQMLYCGDPGTSGDVSMYLGAPIFEPGPVTDPANRVVFCPFQYDSGRGLDYKYGNPQYPQQGTFQYEANNGFLNSTSAGTVTIKVVTVLFKPLTYNVTIEMEADSYVIITLPVKDFDTATQAGCYIASTPIGGRGSLYQYDGRNPLRPWGEPITSPGTQVEDIQPDGTPGSGRMVVYIPPLYQYGNAYTSFDYWADNGLRSDEGVITIDVTPINHAPEIDDIEVTITGHNDTVIITFNGTDIDGDPLHFRITQFPVLGKLYTGYTSFIDPSPSQFNTWSAIPGTMLTLQNPEFYVNQILFDDFNMGARGGYYDTVEAQYIYPGNFSFQIIDNHGAYSNASVTINIQCGPGYVVNTWQSTGGVCIVCPPGATCPTEGQFTPLAQQGYWRALAPQGLIFVACDPAASCLGTVNTSAAITDVNSQCAAGHEARLCSSCQSGYYKLNNECKICPNTSGFVLLILGVPLTAAIITLFVWISRRGIDLTFFSIVIAYWQIIAVFRQYHLRWPTEYVMTVLTGFSIFHANLDIFAFSCYFPGGTYSTKWKLFMAAPIGICAAFMVVYLLLASYVRTCKRPVAGQNPNARKRIEQAAPQRKQLGQRKSSGLANHQTPQAIARRAGLVNSEASDQLEQRLMQNNDPSLGFDEYTSVKDRSNYMWSLIIRTMTLFMFVAYLPVVIKAFQLFCCTAFPDGSETLDADPSLVCYDPWWYELLPWGIVAVVFYGLAVPLWFFWGIKKTHPPFKWTWYGYFFIYPRVLTDDEQNVSEEDKNISAKFGNLSDPSGKPAPPTITPRGKKDPPPPPPAPPQPAAPGQHLHAATVHALEQARAGRADDDDENGNNRLAILKEEEHARNQAAKQAQWAVSSNLALTNAENETLTQQQKIARFMFTLVIDPFRDDLFFWSLILVFRMFLLGMVSIFFADEPVYQATLALLVLFLYTLSTAYFQPYINPQMNKLEFMCMACACLVLFSGFLFVGEQSTDGWIIQLLAAACLGIILFSMLYIARLLYWKLEEIFHCWNCRRVPLVAAPSVSSISAVDDQIRGDIIAGHTVDKVPRPDRSNEVSVKGKSSYNVARTGVTLREEKESEGLPKSLKASPRESPRQVQSSPSHSRPLAVDQPVLTSESEKIASPIKRASGSTSKQLSGGNSFPGQADEAKEEQVLNSNSPSNKSQE